MSWPVSFEQILDARRRLAPHLVPTPLRRYEALDREVGRGIEVWVKHENHQPTNAFKVRNALSVLTAMDPDQRARGVIAASRGNHGQGLAWAGRLMGAPVTVCVPVGNSPEKNDAIRDFGARLIERGRDYDEAVAVAEEIRKEEGLHLVHSTNDVRVLAGAGTMSLEMLEQKPDLEAMVIAVGGGSQAVGAVTVSRRLAPGLRVHAVQAAGASAIHDSWHAGRPVTASSAETFADGLATRCTYEMTFDALREGLAGFTTVTEDEIASALRLLIRTTHNLAEGAGAAGLAGLLGLRDTLAGRRVGIVISGGNIDEAVLRKVLGPA